MHNVATKDDQTRHYLDSLIVKMVCLQSCKDWNALGSAKLSGSIMTETLFQICDILELVDKSILFGRPEILNSGVSISNEWEEVLSDDSTEKYYDPLMDIYYRPLVDALGNPLSIEIEFESAPIFSENEKRHIHSSLEFINEFLTFLAAGSVDWPKVRAFDRLRTFSRGFEDKNRNTNEKAKLPQKKGIDHYRDKARKRIHKLFSEAEKATQLWKNHIIDLQIDIDDMNASLLEALEGRVRDTLFVCHKNPSKENLKDFSDSAEDLLAYHQKEED